MKNLLTVIFLPAIIFSSAYSSSFAQANLISITSSLQYTGDPGSTTVSVTIENLGITVSNPALLGVYFSLDATINPTEDSLIWTMPFGAIGSEALLTIDTTIDLCGEILGTYPSYVFGTYFYVGYIIDYSNLVAESNESDNSDVFYPQLFIGCASGINRSTVAHPIILFPNPVSGVLNIECMTNNKGKVKIYDLAGKLLLEQKITLSGQLDIAAFPSGIYWVEIKNEGQSAVQKVIKN